MVQTETHREDGSHRVVVSGRGIFSSIGNTPEEFHAALKAGKSGIGPLDPEVAEGAKTTIGGMVKDFDVRNYLTRERLKELGGKPSRYQQFAMAAAVQALNEAGVQWPLVDEFNNVGVIIGNGIGGIDTLQKQIGRLFEMGPDRVVASTIPASLVDLGAGIVGILAGARGTNFAVVSACASGTHSIGEAYEKVRYGRLDACLAGASEAALTRIGLAGFDNAFTLCSSMDKNAAVNGDPTRASRPFDKGHTGFVMAEGCGVYYLETMASALDRKAKVFAEIRGYGSSDDAYHIVAPHPEGLGAMLSMQRAMKDAGVTPEMIDYINAHGTSTPLGDEAELKGLRRTFGDRRITVSSTKSMHGHGLGAAGAIELEALIMALEGTLPPTINLWDPIDEAEGFDLVPNVSREAVVRIAMSNNFGFGGHNATLILAKP